MLVSINSAIGGLSWNTSSESSLYITRPFSLDSININSDSITNAPLIEYGALTDSTDLDILYAIYTKNRELISLPVIAVLGPIETGRALHMVDTSAIKKALKKALAPSNTHQCCMAAMTRCEDGGVVDAWAELSVRRQRPERRGCEYLAVCCGRWTLGERLCGC
jgi:choline dehydrogenase